MKQLFHILVLLFIANIAVAQAPHGIPYQAAARNSSGAVLASTAISVRFTIRDSIATGAIKYRETHSVTTTAQGMFSVNVGQGAVVSGTFSGINWATNAKFLQVEMDPAGGSSYIELGTQQMMSVPYAKYAESSGSVSSVGSAFTHYVGEVWGGGVVYHVYRGTDGQEHGLIVALTDQGDEYGATWSNVAEEIGATAQSTWNGLANSNAIVTQSGHTFSAAKLCLDLVSGGYNDWFLPSRNELNLLYHVMFAVNNSLRNTVGAAEISNEGNPETGGSYWSSTETSGGYSAWFISFVGGSVNNYLTKNEYWYVRAVRSF